MKLKITPTCFGSYAIHHQEVQLYLTEITRSGSQMFVVCLVGVWHRNSEPVACVCVCTVRRAGKYSKTCLKRNAIVPVFFFRFHRFPFYKGLCFNKTK